MPRTFSTNGGRAESSSIVQGLGCTPRAPQIRRIVSFGSPLSSAIACTVQWAAPAGFVLSDRSTTSATFSPVTRSPRSVRGPLSNPSIPNSRKRLRHLPSAAGVMSSSAATALLVRPSAQRRIIRQRSDSAPAPLRLRTSLSRQSRSSSSSLSGGARLPGLSSPRAIASTCPPLGEARSRRPLRLSASPSMRSSRKLRRQAATVALHKPNSLPTSRFDRPSAQRTIALQRVENALEASGFRTPPARIDRSSSLRTTSFDRRPLFPFTQSATSIAAPALERRPRPARRSPGCCTMPCSRAFLRHIETVPPLTPSSAATAALLSPSAKQRIARQRRATLFGVPPSRTRLRRIDRSCSRRTTGAACGPRLAPFIEPSQKTEIKVLIHNSTLANF